MCVEVKERFLKTPNVPTGKVTLAAMTNVYPELVTALEQQGIRVLPIRPDPRLQPAIRYHADMILLHLGENKTFVLKETQYLKERLEQEGMMVAETAEAPQQDYPKDVLCNVLLLQNKLLANLGHMDPVLYAIVQMLGLQTMHVNQGYTRCATAVVGENAIITMDRGIYAASQFLGIDALHIEEHNVLLDGYDYGFIGGCCGLIAPDTLAFTGALDSLESGDVIRAFLEKHHVQPLELTNHGMLDIGGILPLKEMAVTNE